MELARRQKGPFPSDFSVRLLREVRSLGGNQVPPTTTATANLGPAHAGGLSRLSVAGVVPSLQSVICSIASGENHFITVTAFFEDNISQKEAEERARENIHHSDRWSLMQSECGCGWTERVSSLSASVSSREDATYVCAVYRLKDCDGTHVSAVRRWLESECHNNRSFPTPPI